MFKKWVLSFSLLVLSVAVASAQNSDHVNYFKVTSGIAQPVTIKTNLGTYTFSGSFVLHGHISSMEAFDYYGNRIVNTQPIKWSRNESWYRFSDIYGPYGDDDSEPGPYVEPPVFDDGGTWLLLGAAVLGVGLYVAGAQSTWYEDTNRWDLGIGLGNKYGPGVLGISLTRRWPRVWGVTGGMGIANYTPDYTRHMKLNCYLGGQVWMYNGWNIEAGLSYFDYGERQTNYNWNGTQSSVSYSYDHTSQQLGWYFMTNTEFGLLGRVGFCGGVGLARAFGQDSRLRGLIDIGLVIRFSAR